MIRERTEALFDGLIAALDFCDAETQWHSRRVSLYARRLDPFARRKRPASAAEEDSMATR
jgi:hypothetical protein